MRFSVDTDQWRLVKWVRRVLNRPPKDWWTYHLPTCGTQYRGCDPECPKGVWEKDEKWVG